MDRQHYLSPFILAIRRAAENQITLKFERVHGYESVTATRLYSTQAGRTVANNSTKSFPYGSDQEDVYAGILLEVIADVTARGLHEVRE